MLRSFSFLWKEQNENAPFLKNFEFFVDTRGFAEVEVDRLRRWRNPRGKGEGKGFDEKSYHQRRPFFCFLFVFFIMRFRRLSERGVLHWEKMGIAARVCVVERGRGRGG